MNCLKCSENIITNDEIVCSKCKIRTHYYCQGINENEFTRMSNNTKKKWACIECKHKLTTNKESYQANKDKVTLENLVDSVQFMSNKFDNFNTTVNKILGEMKKLGTQIKILTENNEKLTSKVNLLEVKIDDSEQKYFNKAVEIVGIPVSPNEDCKSIIKEISQKLNIKCNARNAYRVSTHQKSDMNIIAWLSTKEEKNQLVSASKKNKCTAKQIREIWPSTRFYVNDHLTKFRRILWGKSKTVAREKGFKFVWTKDADILVRKNEHTKVYRIKNEKDLENLK